MLIIFSKILVKLKKIWLSPNLKLHFMGAGVGGGMQVVINLAKDEQRTPGALDPPMININYTELESSMCTANIRTTNCSTYSCVGLEIYLPKLHIQGRSPLDDHGTGAKMLQPFTCSNDCRLTCSPGDNCSLDPTMHTYLVLRCANSWWSD